MSTETTTEEPWLKALRQRVQSLRFGSVQLVIHEGRITQIEATEKLRFDRPEVPAGPKERRLAAS